MNKQKGIIYVRVSSGEQVAGTSLGNQRRLCEEYCKQNEITVSKVFTEEGASAKSTEREEFLKAIEYCRKNNIDAFVVYKVDRFARNTEDHFGVRATLMKYGTNLLSVTEPIGDDPTGKLFETMLAGFADFDNAIRKQRCSDGMSDKLNEGIYPRGAPVGYIPNVARKAENARKEKKNLPDQPHPDFAPILSETLNEFEQGLHTQKGFMKALDEKGFGRLRGKKTTFSFISTILNERRLKFYAGELYNPWTKEIVQGLHEPIITYEVAESIISILKGKKKTSSKKRTMFSPLFPLRGGTARCEECGEPFTGSSPTGNGGTYHHYHCYNKECSMRGKTFRKEDVENAFIKLLKEVTPSDKFVEVYKRAVVDRQQGKVNRYKQEKESYEKKLAQLKKKRERIFAMYEDGAYSPEDFQERKAKVDNEITAYEISNHEAHINELDADAILTQAHQFITSLSDYWYKLDINVKPRFQKYLFPSGITYSKDKGFRTTDIALTFRLNQSFVESNSTLVDMTGFE